MRVAWITNYPAPYRFPVWELLGVELDLTVIFFGANESRGWDMPSALNYQTSALRVTSLDVPSLDMRLSWARGVRKALTKARPNVVVLGGWDSPTYWSALRWSQKNRVPTVTFYESSLSSRRFSRGPIAWARRRFFLAANHHLVMGKSARDALLSMGVPESRIELANNYSELPEPTSTARAASPGHTFIYVGRLIPRKHVDRLIEAFALVAESHDRLLIVGQGPEEDRLRKQVYEGRLQSQVLFCGHRTGAALAAAYDEACTLCLPSSREVWGLVVNEALLRGLHVVVSHDAGVAAAVEHIETVWLTQPSVELLAQAMAASRAAWTGPRVEPSARDFSAQAFAKKSLSAVQKATRYDSTPRQT
jgi:glycosyltransferase involved in cell wall biosynthesis